jgi:hypothetical protein
VKGKRKEEKALKTTDVIPADICANESKTGGYNAKAGTNAGFFYEIKTPYLLWLL